MDVLRLIKIEIWKIVHSKYIFLCFLGELFCLVFAAFDEMSEIPYSLSEIYLSQYMGMVLTIRCIYLSIVISTFFSKDIENKMFDTYIAVGANRLAIAIAKIICIWVVFFSVVIIASLMYVFMSFLLNGFGVIPSEFFFSIVLSIFPLLVHTLLIIGIDVGFTNSVITTFSTVVLIVATSMLPYDISKWIYLSYNNPMIFILYQGEELFRMCGVLVLSASVFAVIDYKLIIKISR